LVKTSILSKAGSTPDSGLMNHESTQEGSTQMARILIVEDEVSLRHVITLNLVRRGHTVAEADSVASADEALVAWKYAFDVMLLDIYLPDQTGWCVLRHLPSAQQESSVIRARPTPRVIVMTAVQPAQSRLDEFRPAAVLLKPFPLQALLRLIERVLALPADDTVHHLGDVSTGDEELDTEVWPGAPPFPAPRVG
jgi:CheY-like chemotaxis protein